MKEATFTQRLIAYVIDIVIVGLIISVLTMGLKNDTLDKLETKEEKLMTELLDGKVEQEEYTKELQTLTYKIEKNSILPNTINILVYIAYFVVFQFLLKGKTIGKKLMKIKVINKDNNDASIIQIGLRSILIDQILPSLILMIFPLILKEATYSNLSMAVSMLTYLFLAVTALMVLYRKDKLALHDAITKTKVVKEGIINE